MFRLSFSISYFILTQQQLTHFSPVSHFYSPWKGQKTFGFSWIESLFSTKTAWNTAKHFSERSLLFELCCISSLNNYFWRKYQVFYYVYYRESMFLKYLWVLVSPCEKFILLHPGVNTCMEFPKTTTVFMKFVEL